MKEKNQGETKTVRVKQRQKNGDFYVLEREYYYDPKTKNNTILCSKLVGKIPKGSKSIVKTRPKKTKMSIQITEPEICKASRMRVGMMDIIDHIGKSSGIDDALFRSTDTGTAQKIISLARYFLATDGNSLPGILTWQYNHPIPYEEGITEDVYHRLFAQIGLDETLQQSYFKIRYASLPGSKTVALDSSTVSTESVNQIDARYGFNKDHDGKMTVKYVCLYSLEGRQPVAFTKQPGNISDVSSLANALKQMGFLGSETVEVIIDNGFYSEANIAELYRERIDFIILAKPSIKWIREEIDKNMDKLMSFQSLCQTEQNYHCMTIRVMHEFKSERKYGSKAKGLSKGDMTGIKRRVYLNVYYNPHDAATDRVEFEKRLLEIKTFLEEGHDVSELTDAALKIVRKYMTISQRKGKTKVKVDEEALKQRKSYAGFFVLVASKENDANRCLEKYRKREKVEETFKRWKQNTDGSNLRVWKSDALRGRAFVQFVALCYYEYLYEKIRKIKEALERSDTGDKTKEEINLEKALRSWLDNTPLHIQLQWFDTIENVKVSDEYKKKRWTTEITARDGLYLSKLGVKLTK